MLGEESRDIPKKIQKYEHFLNEVLKVQLRHLIEERRKVSEDIADLKTLQDTFRAFRINECGKLKTLTDIGGGFFMRAVVSRTDRVLIDVGSKFFVELTLDEADKVVEEKLGLLEAKSDQFRKRACEVQADIETVLAGLRELQKIKPGLKDESVKRAADIW
ncbi:unnamed protein product [Notodromas monacha]|uniref:Protein UXT n=1 Tax=Notodromas monacha TaxID=399045 RepID=A0A7R9BXU1_9CRUS|nr:unnamed protein product [Notodromas monacha]CAG0922229.1 unnamed protein product [Notodromas monacha]